MQTGRATDRIVAAAATGGVYFAGAYTVQCYGTGDDIISGGCGAEEWCPKNPSDVDWRRSVSAVQVQH
jgi:hypothetical protein